jgi:hypothetical protein
MSILRSDQLIVLPTYKIHIYSIIWTYTILVRTEGWFQKSHQVVPVVREAEVAYALRNLAEGFMLACRLANNQSNQSRASRLDCLVRVKALGLDWIAWNAFGAD